MTITLGSIATLLEYRAQLPGTVALVPTMGALHDGHLELVREAKKHADHVIVSNFVNPLQFGPGEDYERYPRDLERDAELLEGLATAMFAPTVKDMYPFESPFQVDVGPIGTVFEGKIRPGHFNGVATVVLKLFLLVQPKYAVFGQKDAQQLEIVRRLVHDFDLPITIVDVDIVREKSGLARSSRNAYLSDKEKSHALVLSDVVMKARKAQKASELLKLLKNIEDSKHVTWDYHCAVDPETFEEISADYEGKALVILAARVGGVRLLDNTRVSLSA